MPTPFRPLAVAVLCTAALGSAHAVPELTATFRDPTGTVPPTDSIDVWITLASTGDSAMTFDLSNPVEPFGIHPDLLPSEGYEPNGGQVYVPFGSYSYVTPYIFRYCTDTFTTGCAAGPYSVGLPTDPSNWFAIPAPFSLAPGETLDVALYTLTPVGGAAPAGTYEAFNMGVGLWVYGYAEDGITELRSEVFAAGTCSSGAADCGFSRTVTAVPEAGTLALWLGGLLPVLAAVRRRRHPQAH